MATCEEGVLIAEPGMKCDHDVELLDECQSCSDEALLPNAWKNAETDVANITDTERKIFENNDELRKRYDS